MHHLVVLSDVHLCEAEPGNGLWMRYRQRPFSPDDEIARMLGELEEKLRAVDSGGSPSSVTLVLNGDIFDFDAPRVVDAVSRFHDQPRTAKFAVPAIEAILRDHPAFLEALGRVLAGGHTIVFISGNHDVQLTLPEVRSLLVGRILDAAETHGTGTRDAMRPRVLFRAWFHKTPDGLLIEHGNQYDPYCSYRYPMEPFGRDEHEIQPTMGSLATRHLVSRMGYFNPHVDSSFMLSVFGYVAHWARYYLFSRRSLMFAWAIGAVRTMIQLWRRRDPERVARRRSNIARAAAETGVGIKTVARHARLFERPAEDRLSLVARELWLDRAAIMVFTVLFAAAWLLLAPLWLSPLGLVGIACFALYERHVPKHSLESNWQRVSRLARKVGKVHRAKAVIFGHTHRPDGSWENGVFFGNTGSWSSAFRDLECTKPLYDERPLVWLTTDERGILGGGLWGWKPGQFIPRVVAETPSPASPLSLRDRGRPCDELKVPIIAV